MSSLGATAYGRRWQRNYAAQVCRLHFLPTSCIGVLERENKMKQPKIIAYMKPSCGWSNGVRAVLKKYNLAYEDRDVINNPADYQEMVEKSGQPLQPTLDIDGKIVADVSGDEVEAWLIKNGFVNPSTAATDTPTNQACQDHPAPTPNISFVRR